MGEWRAVRAHGLAPGASDERIWEALLKELAWVYTQMNRELREYLAPVFMLLELKTIVLCLRNRDGGRISEIERLLTRTLLDDSLQRALRQEADVPASITAMLASGADRLSALREAGAAYAERGLRGFEDALMRGYLAHVVTTRLHPVIREFFRAFIDLRNLMILYKQLRWGIEEGGVFIEGGVLEVSRLAQAALRSEPGSLDELVKEATGLKSVPAAANEGALETVLLGSLTQRLHHTTPDENTVALILDYIWRTYVHARNLAVLYHAGELGAAALERELIA